MILLLANVNSEGQVARLAGLMQTQYWRELWDGFDNGSPRSAFRRR